MFHLKENQTNIKQEIIAGMTTFFTMVYIVAVNPGILSKAGIPFDQVFIATIIAAVVGTLWMALFANYPIAIAPGMGLNVYFTFTVVGGGGISYQTAFSAVFVASILFIILSLTSLRKQLIQAIPDNLKYGITAGIGLFIAFIGLRQSGIIAPDSENLLKLGNVSTPVVILTFVGLTISVILMVLEINGALFVGMLATTLIALATGQLHFPKMLMDVPALPEGMLLPNPTTAFGDVFSHHLYAVVFSFLLVTIYVLARSFRLFLLYHPSPVLIIVGCLMMNSVSRIRWNELDEAFPAFLIILSMPLTSSISTGISLGFISYPFVKLAKGKWREVHVLVLIFAVLFFIQLFFLEG
ncbi:NCS2 family permease [Bacillus zhangzhouensis]|nr:NCS2 family permease [Bacillus zhangzhouensis]